MQIESIIPDFFSTFFMFPFGFRNDQWDKVLDRFKKDTQWEHEDYKINSGLDYNEYVYFYPYIRNILFKSGMENGDKSYGVSYFKDKNISKQNSDFSYEIMPQNSGKVVKLPLKNVFLHLFDTGVGILVFEIISDQKNKLSDLLLFLSNGRRVYVPFIHPDASRNCIFKEKFKNAFKHDQSGESNAIDKLECPVYVSIKRNDQEIVSEDFKKNFSVLLKPETEKPMNWVSDYLPHLSNIITHFLDCPDSGFEYKNGSYWPIIDDRMFTHTFFSIQNDCSNANSNKTFIDNLHHFLNGDPPKEAYTKSAQIWYQMIFIDSQSPTCQNEVMLEQVLSESSYNRWTNWGSFYGFSRFSSVTISNYQKARFIYNHFQTMYYQIAILLFYYRGALLSFSRRSEEIARQVYEKKKAKVVFEKLNKLHQDFILFRNKYWFREVTPQDQGIEIFDLWSSKMRNSELLRDLEDEIRELYNYFNHLIERKENSLLKMITVIGLVGLPLSILTGFFGMNLIENSKSFEAWPFSEFVWTSPGWTYFIVLFIVFYAIIGLVFLIKKINEKIDEKYFLPRRLRR